MDADIKKKRELTVSSPRQKRWSMNSQRLDEIVALLMKPVRDLSRSFDLNLSELLEEYLTEAGLHAMTGTERPAPNFTELALLVQYSVSAYGKKVDYLYTNVMQVLVQLQNTSIEMANGAEGEAGETADADEEAGASAGRARSQRATAAVLASFTAVELQRAPSGALRTRTKTLPPPTLPRAYIELAPTALAPGDVPLEDYGGEPIGLMGELHSCWALRAGLLTDELTRHSAASLRPIPLDELQQNIESRAPPPLACSSPLPSPPGPTSPSPSQQAMLPPPLPPKAPKRKSDTAVAELATRVKLRITKELLVVGGVEFCLPAEWTQHLVLRRSLRVVTLRRSLRVARGAYHDFRGFDYCIEETLGFSGWSASEVEAADATLSASAVLAVLDSDDDGFFEQSSSGESDSCPLQLTQSTDMSTSTRMAIEDLAAWQAGVVKRAGEAAERGGVDVAALAELVLARLPDSPPAQEPSGDDRPSPGPAAAAEAPLHPLDDLLRDTVKHPTDVSRIFLTTLFLANSGNVELISGGPLTIGSCSLRLLSRDSSRYSAVLAEPSAEAPVATTADSPVPSPPQPSSTSGRTGRTGRGTKRTRPHR